MAKAAFKKQSQSLEEIQEALDALSPGIPIDITEKISVTVKPVRTGQLLQFVDAVSKFVPQLAPIIARNNLIARASGSDPTNKNLGGLVGQLVPIVARDFGELINDCVHPVGVFKILEPHQSAGVVATWIEQNVLDKGKWAAWKQAFEPLVDQVETLLPRLTSETSSKSS